MDLKDLRNALKEAENLMKNGLDYEAFEKYREVMTHIQWDSTGERQDLLRQAYKGLCALSLSSDECVWEEASQLTSDYQRMIGSDQ